MDASRPPARIFAVSDVHYDHPGAHEWGRRLPGAGEGDGRHAASAARLTPRRVAAGRSLSGELYRDDAIILAGDIGDTYDAVRLCLR